MYRMWSSPSEKGSNPLPNGPGTREAVSLGEEASAVILGAVQTK